MQIKLRKFVKWETNYAHLYSLSPSIIGRKLYKRASINMTPSKNPERQLRAYKNLKIPKPGASTILVIPGKDAKAYQVVNDIGRDWSKSQGWKKGGGREALFLKWEKRNG